MRVTLWNVIKAILPSDCFSDSKNRPEGAQGIDHHRSYLTDHNKWEIRKKNPKSHWVSKFFVKDRSRLCNSAAYKNNLLSKLAPL